MKRRVLCLMPALVMALLTGCALAQPVRESAGADRWVGYYMVYVPQDVMDAGSASDLRPQGIVWGEWDETTETITFPDMAGSALLMFGREDERITVPSVTEMSPAPSGVARLWTRRRTGTGRRTAAAGSPAWCTAPRRAGSIWTPTPPSIPSVPAEAYSTSPITPTGVTMERSAQTPFA